MKHLHLVLMNAAAGADAPAASGAPAAPAAPAPTPAASPAPATTTDLPVPATPPTPAPKATDAGTTGDVVLDYAVDFITKAGIAEDSAAFIAASNGDFSLLQVELMRSGTAGADKILGILEAKYGEAKAAQEASVKATNAAIFEAVGGEENWVAIKGWAVKNAEPAELTAVNEAFAKGGQLAKMMAHYLAMQFNANNGGANSAAPITTGEPANTPAPSTGRLSRAEYTEAVTQLRQQLGHRMNDSKEYAALRARLDTRR